MSLQGRNERKKKFLDHDVDLLDIDQAMAALLEVAEPEFKDNVELYGAVHVDELRYCKSLATPTMHNAYAPCQASDDTYSHSFILLSRLFIT